MAKGGQVADSEDCADVKAFVRALYMQNSSPLTSVREKIGISFMEYWEKLLETPSTFECTPEDMCPPDTLANTETGLAFTWQHCCDWEEYRATNGEGSATYETIMYACTTLKFRMRFQQLLEELKFHGNEYDPKKIGTDDYPQIKYDQLLQGLVNLNCGSDALDLQEQIRRGHVGLEDEQAHDLGTLLNDLNKAKTDMEAKVEAAKLNMNTTPEQQAKLEKDLARIIVAIVRNPSRLPLRRPAAWLTIRARCFCRPSMSLARPTTIGSGRVTSCCGSKVTRSQHHSRSRSRSLGRRRSPSRSPTIGHSGWGARTTMTRWKHDLVARSDGLGHP